GRLAAARELAREAGEVRESCASGAARLELLAGRGWLAPGEVEVTRSMLHHLAQLSVEQRDAAARARADVARLTALPPDAAALDDEQATGLATIAGRTAGRAQAPDPDARGLLESVPQLRLARLDYLAAEADVRIACAERWPALLIGPKAALAADDFLLGG